MGKGSSPRPYSVPKESFDESFERIFGKKKEGASAPSVILEDEKNVPDRERTENTDRI